MNPLYQDLCSAKAQHDLFRELDCRVQEMTYCQRADKGHWYTLCVIAWRAPLGQICSCLARLSRLCSFPSQRKDLQGLPTLCFHPGMLFGPSMPPGFNGTTGLMWNLYAIQLQQSTRHPMLMGWAWDDFCRLMMDRPDMAISSVCESTHCRQSQECWSRSKHLKNAQEDERCH